MHITIATKRSQERQNKKAVPSKPTTLDVGRSTYYVQQSCITSNDVIHQYLYGEPRLPKGSSPIMMPTYRVSTQESYAPYPFDV